MSTSSSSNEIDLIDLTRVLWKRKILILSGTLLCVVCAIVVIFSITPSYKVSAIIITGEFWDSNTNKSIELISPLSLKELINARVYDPAIKKDLALTGSIPRVKANVPKGTNVLKLSLVHTDREVGIKIVDSLVRAITTDLDNNVMAKLKRGVDSQARKLDLDIEILRMSVGDSRENVVVTPNTEVLRKMQENTKVIKENLLSNMEATAPVELIKPPTFSNSPVRPNKVLIVLLSVVIGVISTSLISFILENVNVRRALKAEDARKS